MRRIVAWCVAGLPFGMRSRRAIDETLADWALEEREAATGGRRLYAGVDGLASMVRVIVISVIREIVDPGWNRGLTLRWGFLAAIVLLLALASAVPMTGALGGQMLTVAILGTPMALLAVLPPAIFLMFAWRPVGRVTPTSGAACLVAVAVLVLAGWLVPLSSDVINALLRQSLDVTLDGDYPARLTRGEALLAVTGWAAVAGASALCAAMVAKRAPLQSRWWLAGVPVIYLVLIPLFTYTIGSSFLVFQSAGDPSVGFRPGIAAWTTAAILVTGGLSGPRTAVE